MVTARAVQYDGYGDRDVLEVREVEAPVSQAGRVIVQVKAAGTNPGESAIRSGAMAEMFPSTFPSGQGSDLAGVVVDVGEGVTAFALGDEVLGWSEERSSQAEYVAVPAEQLVAKPSAMSWEVAGSLYVVACTAYAAVRAVAPSAGETVVVSGAAGGVGTVVVQLLAIREAKVIGLASPDHHAWLESVGAQGVDYAADGLADRIRAAAPQGVDALIDLYGPEYLDLAAELGVAHDRVNTIISFERAGELEMKAEGSSTASTPEVLGEMADHVAAGRISVPIDAAYPLEQVRDAYAELEQRHVHGKIVLTP